MECNSFDFSLVPACGGCCRCEEQRVMGFCQQCYNTDGCCDKRRSTGPCAVFRCAKAHGVKVCGLCSEFPCATLSELSEIRPDIIEHQEKIADIYIKYGEKE